MFFVAGLLQTRGLSPNSHCQLQDINTSDDFAAQSGNFMPVLFLTKTTTCPGSSQKTSLWSIKPILQQVDAIVFLQVLQKKDKIQQKADILQAAPFLSLSSI